MGGTYTEPNATANDNVDGSVSVNISGTVDTNTLGDYVLSYDASDAAGNNAIQVQRTVHVIPATYSSNYVSPTNLDFNNGTATKTGINAFDISTASSWLSWGPNSTAISNIGLNIANPWTAMFRFTCNAQEFFFQFNFFASSVGSQYSGAYNSLRFRISGAGGLTGPNIITNNTTYINDIQADSGIAKLSYSTPNTCRVVIYKNDGTIAAEGTQTGSSTNTLPFYIYNELTNLQHTVSNIVIVQNDTFNYTDYNAIY